MNELITTNTHHHLPTTRAEAKTSGAVTYFDDKPCKHGHTAPKYTRNYSCTACLADQTRPSSTTSWRQNNPARAAAIRGIDHAKRRGAAMPEGFTSGQLIDATVHLYAEAKQRTTDTGIEHEVDHIVPISEGGEHHPSNLRVVTKEFNRQKRVITDDTILELIVTGEWPHEHCRETAEIAAGRLRENLIDHADDADHPAVTAACGLIQRMERERQYTPTLEVLRGIFGHLNRLYRAKMRFGEPCYGY